MRWLLSVLVLASVLRLDAAVAVIHEQVTPGGLDADRVRDLLLGRVTTWPSGNAVVIVLCTSDAGERAVTQICSRSVSLLQRGWKRLVFSGTGAMPVAVDTTPAALALVSRTAGAILILSEAPPPGPYQIISLDEAKPADLP